MAGEGVSRCGEKFKNMTGDPVRSGPFWVTKLTVFGPLKLGLSRYKNVTGTLNGAMTPPAVKEILIFEKTVVPSNVKDPEATDPFWKVRPLTI